MLRLTNFHELMVRDYVLANDFLAALSGEEKEIVVFEFSMDYKALCRDAAVLAARLKEKNLATKLVRQAGEASLLVYSKMAFWTGGTGEAGSGMLAPAAASSLTSKAKEEMFNDVRFMSAVLDYISEKSCEELARIESGGSPEDEDAPELDLPSDEESTAGLSLLEARKTGPEASGPFPKGPETPLIKTHQGGFPEPLFHAGEGS